MSKVQTDQSILDEAIASFDELRLSDVTRDALTRMEIVTPTPIQAATLPALFAGRDVIGQARTGSGKTLAFAIPAIEGVDPRQRGVQVLVLAPTRELAVQVGGVMENLGKAKGVSVGLIFGGRALGPQRDLLRRGVNIVVGTPGRVLDLLNQGALWLDKVRFLVLDEADEMLDRGFAPDVERIIGRTNASRQTALFSATVPDWVRQTADKHLDQPVAIAVDPNPEDAAPIEHVAYDLKDGDKLSALKDLLDHRGEGAIIVFGRTKHGVKKLARQLEGAGYPVAALQGNLSQNARDRVMADFRSGEVPVLLATNVAARGLDVSHVEQVINIELPESPELLTHRIGRTGRMGRQGQAITLLSAADADKWRRLQRGVPRRISRAPWRGARAAIAGEAALAQGQEPTVERTEPAATTPPPPAARSRNGRGASRASDHTERTPGGQRPAAASSSRSRNHPARAVESRPATTLADAWGDAREDTLVTSDRGLVSSYGADPNRPTWVSGDGGGDEHLGARDGDASRGRYEIDCDACGQTASVPFQPDPTRPVYCGDCYRGRRRGRGGRPSDGALAGAAATGALGS